MSHVISHYMGSKLPKCFTLWFTRSSLCHSRDVFITWRSCSCVSSVNTSTLQKSIGNRGNDSLFYGNDPYLSTIYLKLNPLPIKFSLIDNLPVISGQVRKFHGNDRVCIFKLYIRIIIVLFLKIIIVSDLLN